MSGCQDKCCGASCCESPCTCGQNCECNSKTSSKVVSGGAGSTAQVHSSACKCGANCSCNPCNCTEQESAKSVGGSI